jgi:aminoglycoside/choline kinase family phosphotransferase
MAAEVMARLALLGCPARVVVAPGAAGLDRARALASDMRLGDGLIVLDDHAALASIAPHAAVAVAATAIGSSSLRATQVDVPECLAPFAAAGVACMAQLGSSTQSWVIAPQEPEVNGVAVCLARLLRSPDALATARAQAHAAAALLRGTLQTA